jgi:hypothetical protein
MLGKTVPTGLIRRREVIELVKAAGSFAAKTRSRAKAVVSAIILDQVGQPNWSRGG